jgi:UDP-N-acetyl-2-amino-2-deoxyglucuronate dehydrogenase
MMSDHAHQLKLAFLGCGGIARDHLLGVQQYASRIQVTAAIDLDQDKAQAVSAATGAHVFTTLEQALAEGQFDAVDIMLPHHLHESTAVTSFEAGKHVLLEKPMATTLDACERILESARRAGTVFLVGEHAHYWPEVARAKQLIEDGAVGRVFTARATAPAQLDPYWFPNAQCWRFDKARTGGGITIDGGSHYVRPLRMWMGEIDEVVATMGHPLTPMQGESLVQALLRFESGDSAMFEFMIVDTVLGAEAMWRITGTRGQLAIYRDRGLWLHDAEHRDGIQVLESRGRAAAFGLELADFAAAVLDGKPLAAGPEESIADLRAALAMYRSVQSKRWKKVRE